MNGSKTVAHELAHRVVRCFKSVWFGSDDVIRSCVNVTPLKSVLGNVSSCPFTAMSAWLMRLTSSALFTKSMLNDHLPSHYERSTQLLFDGMGQGNM